jgi:predicted GNAT family N-acyltransferase
MKVKFIPHSKIDQKLLLKIIEVKMVAWPYSMEEQLKWIDNNIEHGDIHVILVNDNEDILAYLNLIDIETSINHVKYKALGIGNVCAAHKGKGFGSTLLKETNDYLIHKKKVGLLFCNNQLLPFYRSLRWKLISKDAYGIKGVEPKTNVLAFNFHSSIRNIEYKGKLF